MYITCIMNSLHYVFVQHTTSISAFLWTPLLILFLKFTITLPNTNLSKLFSNILLEENHGIP